MPKNGLSVVKAAECMGGIIDDLETMPFGNLPDGFDLTRVAVNVRRENCGRAFGESVLDSGRIQVQRVVIDVDHYRSTTLPDDAGGRRNITKWGGNNFTLEAQCIDRDLEG